MNQNAKPYLDEFKQMACLAVLDTLKPKNIIELRIASDVLKISETVISFCHIVPTLLYHQNACTTLKVSIAKTRRIYMNQTKATKNKRETHNNKETDGEKDSNGAAQSEYRIEWK